MLLAYAMIVRAKEGDKITQWFNTLQREFWMDPDRVGMAVSINPILNNVTKNFNLLKNSQLDCYADRWYGSKGRSRGENGSSQFWILEWWSENHTREGDSFLRDKKIKSNFLYRPWMEFKTTNNWW